MNIDNFKRYNKISTCQLFPSIPGKCACGCGNDLTGRKRRWFDESHGYAAYVHTAIIQGNLSVIRHQLFLSDEGACRKCGEITEDWDADHIVPVFKGGGACTLDNFQTLCKACHKEKTKLDFKK